MASHQRCGNSQNWKMKVAGNFSRRKFTSHTIIFSALRMIMMKCTRITHINSCHHSGFRSEEHTSELQSLMRISYAVFCLKKTKHTSSTPLNLKDEQHMKNIT